MTKRPNDAIEVFVAGEPHWFWLEKRPPHDYWIFVQTPAYNSRWGGMLDEHRDDKAENEFVNVINKVREFGLPALLDMAYWTGWSDGRWGVCNKESIADDKATE